jgi:hypothetical protein
MNRRYLVILTETERAALGQRLAAGTGLGGAVNWRFTTEDARVKLKPLYPSLDG